MATPTKSTKGSSKAATTGSHHGQHGKVVTVCNTTGRVAIATTTVTLGSTTYTVPVKDIAPKQYVQPTGGQYRCVFGGYLGTAAWRHNMLFLLNPQSVLPVAAIKALLGHNYNYNRNHIMRLVGPKGLCPNVGKPCLIASGSGYQLNPAVVAAHPTLATAGPMQPIAVAAPAAPAAS